MKTDRAPSMPAWMCKTCGFPLATRMTDLQIAEHDAYHLAAEKRLLAVEHKVFSNAQWINYAHALERLDRARVADRRAATAPLHSKIVDLELEVGAYKYDLKVLTDLVDDLKADLAAVEEGRH